MKTRVSIYATYRYVRCMSHLMSEAGLICMLIENNIFFQLFFVHFGLLLGAE